MGDKVTRSYAMPDLAVAVRREQARERAVRDAQARLARSALAALAVVAFARLAWWAAMVGLVVY